MLACTPLSAPTSWRKTPAELLQGFEGAMDEPFHLLYEEVLRTIQMQSLCTLLQIPTRGMTATADSTITSLMGITVNTPRSSGCPCQRAHESHGVVTNKGRTGSAEESQ